MAQNVEGSQPLGSDISLKSAGHVNFRNLSSVNDNGIITFSDNSDDSDDDYQDGEIDNETGAFTNDPNSDDEIEAMIEADFMDSEFSSDIQSLGSGTLTKQYNRSRNFIESSGNTAIPRFNPKGGSVPAAVLAAKEKRRIKEQEAALAAAKAAGLSVPENSSASSKPAAPRTFKHSSNQKSKSVRFSKDEESKEEEDDDNVEDAELEKLASRINLGNNKADDSEHNDDNETVPALAQSSSGPSSLAQRPRGSAWSDRAHRATTEQVLDPRTRMILFKMINRGVLYEINGCISTGKEANVYHALTEEGEHRAIKIYKTSILVFKDRDRYVTGEFRFRNGYSKHNPRKMVKLWAEKEFRNLRRIATNSDIPVPQPLFLRLHVLVMEFLGTKKGWPSPRLRDADHLIEDPDTEYQRLYYELIAYMRILYQQCRLVHADLSEYNILYHKKKLWIIDVSQSVEHDHPHSLEFLRMDIKNVTDFFRKKGHTETMFNERRIFQFITTPDPVATFFNESTGVSLPEHITPIQYDGSNGATGGIKFETTPYLVSILESFPKEELTQKDVHDDAIFREVYIPQNLEQVYDVDRDVETVRTGNVRSLIYGDMLFKNGKEDDDAKSLEASAEKEEKVEGDAEEDEDGEDDEEEEDDDEEEDNDDDDLNRVSKDKEKNKERKKKLKELAREKRQKKLKKSAKKKIINQASAKKKK